ncbi:MAG: hypothetical protein QOH24_2391 [Verrucomicrobiota bacterium]
MVRQIKEAILQISKFLTGVLLISVINSPRAHGETPHTGPTYLVNTSDNHNATERTNKHFQAKNPLKRSDLNEFVNCYFGRNGAGESEPDRHRESPLPKRNPTQPQRQ